MKFFITFVIAAYFVEQGTSITCTKPHQVYHACSNGCQTTCQNFQDPPVCIAACLKERAGCYCEPPYVLSGSGDCVLTSECKAHKCLRPHEKYLTCSNGCETTCRNRRNPPLCFKRCVPEKAGCYCAFPYIRKHEKGECILPNQC